MTTQTIQLGRYPAIPAGRFAYEDPANSSRGATAAGDIQFGAFVERVDQGAHDAPRVQAISALAAVNDSRNIFGLTIIQELPVGRSDTATGNFVGYAATQPAAVAFRGVVVVRTTTTNRPSAGQTRGLRLSRAAATNGYLTVAAAGTNTYDIGDDQLEIIDVSSSPDTAIVRIWLPISITRTA